MSLTCAPWSSLIHVPVDSKWGGVKTWHSNLIIFPAVQQAQALLFHDQLPVGQGGVGWGNNVMFLCTHRRSKPHHLSCCPADTRHCSFMISYRWGGAGWGGTIWNNNVHVPVHTQTHAQRPHHLSCCPADTTTALSWSVTGGVGWGGTITFMFLYTHRHSLATAGGMVEQQVGNLSRKPSHISKSAGACRQSIANGSRG